jgi:hypothetical protein
LPIKTKSYHELLRWTTFLPLSLSLLTHLSLI